MNDFPVSPVGVFGGTFDPVHYGHLRIAEEIAELVGLREMRFVPAGIPRLRRGPEASLEHRVEMVRRAIDGNSRFILDEREVVRGGVSYSVDTLRELRQELGKDIVLCFVTGADAFIRLAEWHRWRELFGLCHFIIAARPGHLLSAENRPSPAALPQELEEECRERWTSSAEILKYAPGGLIFTAQTTLLDISATAIRKRVASGKSIRYLVPESTRDYIAANDLYRE
ncbi:nicotinate-nucleotide adenylyltransferase [Nitrosospira multiformis]|uniref:Probable nicotinate-nucleotide adenylyltransferase n=1 Tax=Nitrosospira multiformis (strain ATCC 25196 / NCIMB 11849 / C 71) TaxID=323848 RepID=Q2YC53_NITMU|nr:nicotinate-nucleotide adenylyltransferase [Nitrosospira multiformis]ABB73668.1 nicotinate-nucleotide adenylyltransferase [Nitrosospira multiformis ATCC 25196]SDZ75772.1 nicotinate-nucleotide adenylyltransferase [Nitrosospira multiformis]SEF39586.1 nicotinate-nucleotide adenylyltransferase [Nitrosospira multiformis ATCC 25196]